MTQGRGKWGEVRGTARDSTLDTGGDAYGEKLNRSLCSLKIFKKNLIVLGWDSFEKKNPRVATCQRSLACFLLQE